MEPRRKEIAVALAYAFEINREEFPDDLTLSVLLGRKPRVLDHVLPDEPLQKFDLEAQLDGDLNCPAVCAALLEIGRLHELTDFLRT